MPSLSRQLARWIVGLRYEDLPPEVIDRAKGVTLHGLASVLLGSRSPDGAEAVKLIVEEEAGVRAGAAIMVNGTRVTKGGAAFANAEMAYAGGKWDTFRMLTHPGTSIIPGPSSRRKRRAPPAESSSPPSRRATRSWSGWRPTSFRR
jgi:2-methylcitrate dehydratase PrpD